MLAAVLVRPRGGEGEVLVVMGRSNVRPRGGGGLVSMVRWWGGLLSSSVGHWFIGFC